VWSLVSKESMFSSEIPEDDAFDPFALAPEVVASGG